MPLEPSVEITLADTPAFVSLASENTEAWETAGLIVLILTNVQSKVSVSKTPSVVILKEVIVVTVPTATRETCVRTLMSATV